MNATYPSEYVIVWWWDAHELARCEPFLKVTCGFLRREDPETGIEIDSEWNEDDTPQQPGFIPWGMVAHIVRRKMPKAPAVWKKRRKVGQNAP